MQVGVMHTLQYWLHPQGISKMSKTNMLIACELRNTSRSQATKKEPLRLAERASSAIDTQ